MYINCIKETSTQIRNVKQIYIQEDDSDLEEMGNLLKDTGTGSGTNNNDEPKPTDGAKWNIKQYSINEFYGCALFVGKCNITNLDIETIFNTYSDSENKAYALIENSN